MKEIEWAVCSVCAASIYLMFHDSLEGFQLTDLTGQAVSSPAMIIEPDGSVSTHCNETLVYAKACYDPQGGITIKPGKGYSINKELVLHHAALTKLVFHNINNIIPKDFTDGIQLEAGVG